jgi:hypothetical protein
MLSAFSAVNTFRFQPSVFSPSAFSFSLLFPPWPPPPGCSLWSNPFSGPISTRYAFLAVNTFRFQPSVFNVQCSVFCPSAFSLSHFAQPFSHSLPPSALCTLHSPFCLRLPHSAFRFQPSAFSVLRALLSLSVLCGQIRIRVRSLRSLRSLRLTMSAPNRTLHRRKRREPRAEDDCSEPILRWSEPRVNAGR